MQKIKIKRYIIFPSGLSFYFLNSIFQRAEFSFVIKFVLSTFSLIVCAFISYKKFLLNPSTLSYLFI